MNNIELLELSYCEKYGITEVYKRRGYTITYYSYFGLEGFYRITYNLKTKKEVRKHLRYKYIPKFLINDNGFLKYNYFCG